jgi:hypothetical protein
MPAELLDERKISKLSPSEQNALLKKNIEKIILRIKEDPWFFMVNFCWTLDTHDPESPIKKFPNKGYLEKSTEVWFNNKILYIPKSRQMMISWLMVGLHYWLAAYHQAQNVFFQSKKEDDADLLLDRAWFIHCHVPEFLRVPCKRSYCNMAFKDIHSRIQAVSQSSDAVRSQTASAILSDETAFQPYARDSYSAAKPTIDGGGRYTAISTPNGKEYFHNRVFDLE